MQPSASRSVQIEARPARRKTSIPGIGRNPRTSRRLRQGIRCIAGLEPIPAVDRVERPKRWRTVPDILRTSRDSRTRPFSPSPPRLLLPLRKSLPRRDYILIQRDPPPRCIRDGQLPVHGFQLVPVKCLGLRAVLDQPFLKRAGGQRLRLDNVRRRHPAEVWHHGDRMGGGQGADARQLRDAASR